MFIDHEDSCPFLCISANLVNSREDIFSPKPFRVKEIKYILKERQTI